MACGDDEFAPGQAWRYGDAKLLPMPGPVSPFWDSFGHVINGKQHNLISSVWVEGRGPGPGSAEHRQADDNYPSHDHTCIDLQSKQHA